MRSASSRPTSREVTSAKQSEKAFGHALSYLLAVITPDVANIVVNSALFASIVRSIKLANTDVLCIRSSRKVSSYMTV